MKIQRDGGVKLIYRGQSLFVDEVNRFSRNGDLSDELTVYVLENGKRILPIHFKFGLAKIPGNIITWLLKVTYRPEVFHPILRANSLLSKIPKDTNWKCGTFLVPVELK